MTISRKHTLLIGSMAGVLGFLIAMLLTIPGRSTVSVAAGPDPVGLMLTLVTLAAPVSCLLIPLMGLIPFASAVLYARHGNRPRAVVGGACTGAWGGLVYGVLSVTASLASNTGVAVALQDVDPLAAFGNPAYVGAALGIVFAVVVGLVFGALGAIFASQATRSPAQGRWRRVGVIAGCGILTLACVVLAIWADAARWQNSARGPSAAPAGDPRDAVAELPPGNAQAGQAVFVEAGCAGCHATSATHSVGPALPGLGERAATRKPGASANTYLYESIVNPGAFVVEGYRGDLMPPGYGQRLSVQELADLVAFLASQ